MKGINTFTLKWIAIISMLIDHIGLVLFPEEQIFRIIGRLAFPIFAYTLTEGFLHTGNIKKYLIRLGIFAVISEVPYDLLFGEGIIDWSMQNVFLTLFLGLSMIVLITRITTVYIQVLTVIMIGIISEILGADYGTIGILTIWLFYYLRDKKIAKYTAVSLLMLTTQGVQMFAALALIPIGLHNGKRGPKMKYIFYIIYPLHLLILYFIQLMI